MIQVIDGQVVKTELPTTGTINGKTVSGYNLLPSDVLASEGWLPSENNIPSYNVATQTIEFDSYTIQADKVIVNYRVVTKEITLEERNRADIDYIAIMTGVDLI